MNSEFLNSKAMLLRIWLACFFVRRKTQTEIKCDFDGLKPEVLLRIVRGWKFLFLFYWPCNIGQLKFQRATVCKTAHGFHVRVWVRNSIPDFLLPFLQLCLRSHRAREVLNLTRVLTPELQDGHQWNVLFDTKYRAVETGLEKTGEEKKQRRLTNQVTGIIRSFSQRRRRRVKKK